MTIIHVPSHGSDDPEIAEVFVKGALPEHATVPLVVYVDGKRRVVGEATITSGEITAELGDDVGEELMDQLFNRAEQAHFSIGFSMPPYPFTQPKKYEF